MSLAEKFWGDVSKATVHFNEIEYTTAVKGLPHSILLALNRDVINPHDGHILCGPNRVACGFSLRIHRSSRIVNTTINRPKEILAAFITATLLGEFRVSRVEAFRSGLALSAVRLQGKSAIKTILTCLWRRGASLCTIPANESCRGMGLCRFHHPREDSMRTSRSLFRKCQRAFLLFVVALALPAVLFSQAYFRHGERHADGQ